MMKRRPIDSRIPKASWDIQHKRVSELHITWQLSAASLRYASEVLFAQLERDLARPRGNGTFKSYRPSLNPTGLMLAGLMIENLAKAALVSRGSPLDKKGAISLKSHKLLDLVEGLGVKLSEEEALLLERLTEFITWAGKYPVPLVSEKGYPRIFPDGGSAPLAISYLERDWLATKKIAAKIQRLIPGKRPRLSLPRLKKPAKPGLR